MSEEKETIETYLIPFGINGKLTDVRENILESIENLKKSVKDDAIVFEAIITNWAISAITANELKRELYDLNVDMKNRIEKVSKAYEESIHSNTYDDYKKIIKEQKHRIETLENIVKKLEA